MRKFLLVSATIIGVLGVILSLIMSVSAIRFYELGRVLLYFITMLVCVEMSVICIMKLLSKK